MFKTSGDSVAAETSTHDSGTEVREEEQQKSSKAAEVGLAKMLLGIARGNAQLATFFELVGNPDKVTQLLVFKESLVQT